MERRNFLIGMGAASAGGGILLGSGAFSRVESDRYMTIEVAEDPDAYLGLDACDSPHGEEFVDIDDSGHLYVDIGETGNGGEGVNSDSRTWFDDLIQLCNQGTEDACIWIDRGDDWPVVEEGPDEGEPRVDFYLGEDEESILGEENATEIGVGECECIGIRTNTHGIDATAEETLLEEVDDVVTLVADVDCPDAGPQPGQAFFEVSDLTPTAISVEPGETFDVSATITNAGDTAGEQDVELLLDGELVDARTLSLGPGEDETVAFEDVATDDLEEGEHEVKISTDDDENWIPLTTGWRGEGPLEVLYLGGVEDGATHYSEDLYQVLAPYLLDRGVEVFYTERQDDLNPATLAHYDAVMLYGNRLNPTEEQIDALVGFVEDGGGFVPIHSASASFTSSDDYVSLVGGQFNSHGNEVMSTDRVDHPVFDGVEEIEMFEETYRHTNFNDDIQVLATATGGDYGEDEDEPFTWVREQGDGRVFYTAWGHYEDGWEEPGFRQLLTNGIRWVSGHDDALGDFDSSAVPEKTFTNVSEYGHGEVPYYQGDAPDAVSTADDGTWDLVQDPFPAAESMAHAFTPAEFELEYFVSEDVMPDGVEGEILDVTFGAAGRCWLSVTQDYPNDGGDGNDQIVICEDTDGDGMADEFTVFQDGLSIPHSLIPYRDGVIVAEVGVDESGRVVYFGDEDGDDVADVEDEIFSGYGTGDTHAGLNQLYWGHDNWIYGVVGYSGLNPSIDEDLNLNQDVFRFRPDGSEIEFVGGGASNMAGVKTNEEGLVFCSSATAGNNVTSYAAIPAAYYDYIEGFEGFTTVDIRAPFNLSRTEDENRVLPVNDRYRQVDFHDGFTAATDQEIYTAREFPQQYWNSTTFVSDGTANLTSTFYLEQDGASYESIYHHNLFASNDEWTSPTYVNTGPDGMVWLIDMYNFIFQHNPTPPGYETPPGGGNAYETNVRDTEHSRLYRITTGPADPHPQDLSDASASELLDALSDDNMFWRQTAQRKLIERGETDVVDDLVDLAASEDLDDIGLDVGAIHALWTLDGLDAVEDNEGTLLDALTHSSAGVRLNALRVLPGTAATRDAILNEDLLNDEDGRVQMWALLALATTPESDAAGEAIYHTIADEDNGNEDLLIDAASPAAATHADGFVTAYEANEDTSDDDDEESENLFENPGFEETEESVGPDDWFENTFGGTFDLTWAKDETNSGDRSLAISSPAESDGADAAWSVDVPIEEDTEYTFSAMVKTEDVEIVDGTGLSEVPEAPLGVTISVEELANGAWPDVNADAWATPLTGTNDWTELTVTFNTADVPDDAWDGNTLQVNALFGGYGNATGTAWWDGFSLVGEDGTNVVPNPDVESGTSSSQPTGWESSTWGGSAEFTHDSSESRNGDYSVLIESEDGADASWSQVFDVQPNTQYRFSAYVKTGPDFEPTTGFSGGPFGATLNVHELGQSSLANAVEEADQDWTYLETTINSGANNTLTFNVLYGGWGSAIGKAWWDDAELIQLSGFGGGVELVYDRVQTHLELTGGGGDPGDDDEEVLDAMPADWEHNPFGEGEEFAYVSGVSSDEDRSIRISSTEGTDAAWSTFGVPVEEDTEYTFSAMVKTEDVETQDGFAIGPLGATISVEEYANVPWPPDEDAVADPLTGTNDWTELSVTFNTADVQAGFDEAGEEWDGTLQLNALFGGYGSATGTAWWDDVSLVGEDGTDVIPNGSFEQERPEGIDPSETIEFEGEQAGWQGVAPESIAGEENPTLTLVEGGEYTLEWTNADGMIHWFAIGDDANPTDATVLTESDDTNVQGETITFEFTATAEMAGYHCPPHLDSMVGEIDVVDPAE